MKKLGKGTIKKIVLISISSIYTIFFIMVLTMPFGSKISNYVGNIINNVRDNVSLPISLDDNYFEFTDFRENITMGKNEIFPYQINNLIKYDMIYEADENLIIHQYSNYLKIESIYQEESYQANLKITCKQVPSYSKEYTFNVIKPQENQISLNTSLLSNYLYDNETTKYTFGLNVGVNALMEVNYNKETLNKSFIELEYDKDYFKINSSLNLITPIKEGENLIITAKLFSGETQTFLIDIVDFHKFTPNKVKFFTQSSSNYQEITSNEIDLHEELLIVPYLDENPLILPYVSLTSSKKYNNVFSNKNLEFHEIGETTIVINYDNTSFEKKFIVSNNNVTKRLTKEEFDNIDIIIKDGINDITDTIYMGKNITMAISKDVSDGIYFKYQDVENLTQSYVRDTNKYKIQFSYPYYGEVTLTVNYQDDINTFTKELTFKVREAPLDVINDPYLIAAKFCGHFCGFFLSGLLIMITLIQFKNLKFRYKVIISVSLAVFLPALVEVIQMLEPGRFGGISELYDALCGCAGFLVASALTYLAYYLIRRHKKKKAIKNQTLN